MTSSVMSTSVRQEKNCTSLPGIQRSVPCATKPMARTAITARSNPHVQLASKDAASVAVSMRRYWNGCARISKRALQKGLAQASGLGRTLVCRKKGLAWHAPFSLAAALARELRGAHARSRTKSQAALAKTRLGTAALSSRSRFCPLFGCILVVDSSFFRILVLFLADELILLNTHEGI